MELERESTRERKRDVTTLSERLLQCNLSVVGVYKLQNSYPVRYDDGFNDARDAEVV